MSQSNRIWFRLLGLFHVVIAIILLPSALFLGFISALVVMPALVWLAVLGVWLWRPSIRLRMLLKGTHLLLTPFWILLIVYGGFALGAAQRSAEAGGGLLGGFGFIPIVMGLLTGSVSIVSLYASRLTTFKKMTRAEPGNGEVRENPLEI